MLCRMQTLKILPIGFLALLVALYAAALPAVCQTPSTTSPSPTASPTLYPGERIVQLAGYPAMVRFFKGDANKPLLVFVPGQSHLARIAYGPPGSRPEDFLAFWLQKEGYNFLAFSFPIATLHPVFDKPYPDYTGEAWGKQIALAAQQAIQENALTNNIVLLNWSMGGRAMEIATIESKKLGLSVEAGISMVATPPIPKGTPKSTTGMLHKEDSSGRLAMIHSDEADNGGRILIPVDTYTSEFVGDMPNDLANYSSFDMNGYPSGGRRRHGQRNPPGLWPRPQRPFRLGLYQRPHRQPHRQRRRQNPPPKNGPPCFNWNACTMDRPPPHPRRRQTTSPSS